MSIKHPGGTHLIALFVFLGMMSVVSCAFGQIVPRESVRKNHEEKIYRILQGTLLGTMTADMVTTGQSLTHPRYAAYTLCKNTTGSGTACNSTYNVTLPGAFQEIGWAKFVGSRNAPGVIGANVAFDAGLLITAHFFYKKGGWWRKAAFAALAGQSSAHLYGAIHNFNTTRQLEQEIVPPGAVNVQWYNNPR